MRARVIASLVFIIGLMLAGNLWAVAPQPPYLTGYLRDSLRAPSTYVDARSLAASTAKTVTVPTFPLAPGSFLVLVFSANCTDYYVRYGGTATVPSGDVTDGTASERNPSAMQLVQGDSLSIISPTTCIVTISYYLKSNV
jgi:hypothetical protein